MFVVPASKPPAEIALYRVLDTVDPGGFFEFGYFRKIFERAIQVKKCPAQATSL
jgi:hypothetical protein